MIQYEIVKGYWSGRKVDREDRLSGWTAVPVPDEDKKWAWVGNAWVEVAEIPERATREGIDKANAIAELKRVRDQKLAENKVEVRPGEFLRTRVQDSTPFNAVLDALPAPGASYEFWNGGDFITLSKSELQQAMSAGQAQIEAIWDEFKSAVKALG